MRHQLFLPHDLSQRLEALAAKPGAAKSAILADALTAWLNRQAVSRARDEVQRCGSTACRLALGRIERDGHILLESLALFVRYQLTVQAPLADGDEARARGRPRPVQRLRRRRSCGEAMASGQANAWHAAPSMVRRRAMS